MKPQNLPPRHAIVADDVPETRDTVLHLLERNGFTAISAKSSHEAARLLSSNPCDLLVLETQMSEGDGIELISELRRTDSTVRILATARSGNALGADHRLRLAKAMGAHAGLMKPFGQLMFLAAVNDALAAEVPRGLSASPMLATA